MSTEFRYFWQCNTEFRYKGGTGSSVVQTRLVGPHSVALRIRLIQLDEESLQSAVSVTAARKMQNTGSAVP